MPAAPVTPHGEDVLPAIGPQPALQQCRDALTTHTEDKFRTWSRPPRGHTIVAGHATLTEMWTFWAKVGGQSVGIDKDYSLRCIVFRSISCLEGRASLSLTLCYWYKEKKRIFGRLSAPLLTKGADYAAFVSRCSWFSALCRKMWRMCDRTVVLHKEAAKLPPSGHGGYHHQIFFSSTELGLTYSIDFCCCIKLYFIFLNWCSKSK